jgi:hypothetical protein
MADPPESRPSPALPTFERARKLQSSVVLSWCEGARHRYAILAKAGNLLLLINHLPSFRTQLKVHECPLHKMLREAKERAYSTDKKQREAKNFALITP